MRLVVVGEVPRWQDLAHRTAADLQAAGPGLRLSTTARRVDPVRRRLEVADPVGTVTELDHVHSGPTAAARAAPGRVSGVAAAGRDAGRL
jgi:hypothetical protein